MRKKWLIFVAAMTTLSITACGSGDGIVINGTTAAEAESDQLEEEGSAAESQNTSGTRIEIVRGDHSPGFHGGDGGSVYRRVDRSCPDPAGDHSRAPDYQRDHHGSGDYGS